MLKHIAMRVFIICLFIISFYATSVAQVSEPMAMHITNQNANPSDSTKKVFRNSEPEGVTFIVNSNLKENKIQINTNYTGIYKVQFIDYYAGSRKVYKNQQSNMTIDVGELERSIFIMNISDSKNKLLTSQVLNLKRRHL